MPKTGRSRKDVRTRGFAPGPKRPGNAPKTIKSSFNPNEARSSDFNRITKV